MGQKNPHDNLVWREKYQDKTLKTQKTLDYFKHKMNTCHDEESSFCVSLSDRIINNPISTIKKFLKTFGIMSSCLLSTRHLPH